VVTRVGFAGAKSRLIKALREGRFLHEARDQVETKNLLLMGQVTTDEVLAVVGRCFGQHHSSSPHHADPRIDVHILRRDGWYVKFYFIDPDTIFISVHK
jgi:hypothetical protein